MLWDIKSTMFTSSEPKWFDGSRAMKVITNVVSHKVNAQYIIPKKIKMEDGIWGFETASL